MLVAKVDIAINAIVSNMYQTPTQAAHCLLLNAISSIIFHKNREIIKSKHRKRKLQEEVK